ncbi:MAG: prepilin peptidase [Pseudomonadaceae bacterium]|nr:prepilin peptidase [Pseudomonadaceae bacterium]
MPYSPLWPLEVRALPPEALAGHRRIPAPDINRVTLVLALAIPLLLWPAYGPLALLLAFPLARLLVLDACCYLLPNLYTLPLISGGVVYAWMSGFGTPALMMVAVLLLVREGVLRLPPSRIGIGGGDFMLLAALFSWLPLAPACFAVALGCVIYLPVAFALPGRPIPFGVPLIAGWLLMALLGQTVLRDLPLREFWPI